MGSKKEGAQRILDAQASSHRVKKRVLPVAGAILLIGLVVAFLSRWEFGLATVLICGLLLQYAVERMNTLLEASVANGLKDMGWDHPGEFDEETLKKIRTIAEK
tara:strand:- start:9176 stop:9487 length:312 start_codon:yes stop_codon:yes gene_type:complete